MHAGATDRRCARGSKTRTDSACVVMMEGYNRDQTLRRKEKKGRADYGLRRNEGNSLCQHVAHITIQ